MLASNAILYAIGPILSKISNGPQNLGANFAQLLSFIEILFGFSHK